MTTAGRALLLIGLLLAGCRDVRPALPPPPADHAGLAIRHAQSPAAACDDCHGPDACQRCHLTRAPGDHSPGYSGWPHAMSAHLDPERCATCHTGPTCARCH